MLKRSTFLITMLLVSPLVFAKKQKDFSFEKSVKERKESAVSVSAKKNLIKKGWSVSLKSGSPKKRYYPEISEPVESMGVIYVGTQGGFFYAIESSTGKKLWEYNVEAPVATRAIVANGRVYFLDLAGRLNALNLQGESLWQRDLHKEVLNPPVVVGEKLYFLKGDKEIACVSAISGEPIWSQPLPVFVKRMTIRGQAQLVVEGSQLIAALADGNLYGVDLATGAVRWNKNFAPPLKTFRDIDADLVADQNAYYVAGYFDQVHKVNKATKNIEWTLDVGSGVSPLLWQNKILVADLRGNLDLYNTESGILDWKTELKGAVLGQPALFENHFFVTNHKGEVLMLDPQTGDVVQRLSISGGAITKPLVLADRVVVMSGQGTLTSFLAK